jgi:hypothetical protein
MFSVLLMNVRLAAIPQEALENRPDARFPFFSLVPWIGTRTDRGWLTSCHVPLDGCPISD